MSRHISKKSCPAKNLPYRVENPTSLKLPVKLLSNLGKNSASASQNPLRGILPNMNI